MTRATRIASLAFIATACAFAWSPLAQSASAPTREAIEQMMMQGMRRPVTEETRTDDGVQVVIQSGHAQGIELIAMSADGRFILTGSHDGTAKLWDIASGRELRTFSGFFEGMSPQTLAFTADSRFAVIGDGMQTYLYDVETGRQERSIGGLGGIALFGGRSALAPGGRFVASATGDQDTTIQVIELATGRVVWSTPKGDVQTPLALSDDGSVLLAQRMKVRGGFFGGAGLRMEVQLWDVTAGKLRGALPAFTADDARMARFVLSPDGQYVLIGSQQLGQPMSLYAIDGTAPLATLSAAGNMANWQQPPVFSPDGTKLLQASEDNGGGAILVWEIPGGRLLKQIPGRSAAFSADGSKLALGLAGTGAPVVQDLSSGRNQPLTGGGVALWELATLAGGTRAVATLWDGSMQVWDLATGLLLRGLRCPEGVGAVSVAAMPDATSAIVGCSDGAVWRWELSASDPSPRQLMPPLPAGSLKVHAGGTEDVGTRPLVAFTRDGRRIVVSRNDRVSVLDAADGSELLSFTLPPGKPMAMEDPFAGMDAATLKSLPKEVVASMENSRSMQQDPQTQAMLQYAADAVATLAIDPSGRWLAVGREGDLGVWDLQTGTLARSLGGAASGGFPGGLNMPAGDLGGMIGGQLSKREMKQLEKLMGAAGSAAVVPGGAEQIGDAMGQFQGARRVAFRPNGVLLAIGALGPQLWDVASGARLPSPFGRDVGLNAVMSGQIRDPNDVLERVSDAAFSPDGALLALVEGSEIHLVDPDSGIEFRVLRGHRSGIRSMAFTADGERLVSGGNDGTLRIWSVPKATELAQLIALGGTDFVAVTPDQYYRSSRSRVKGIAFRVNGELYPFEQFDLRFNRPDIVLERLGLAGADAIQTYRQAYERRLKKLGFTQEMLGTDFHLPEVEIVGGELPVSTNASTLPLTIRARDDRYPLDRIQVFVNDVPVFGSRGITLDGTASSATANSATANSPTATSVERQVTVPLVAGRNKIQASALNRQGAESLRATAYTNAVGDFPPGETYIVTIGVSQYANAAYNLRYAAKDAADLATLYAEIAQRIPGRGTTHVLSLTNERATRDEIRAAREWLLQAKVGDLAIVFAAGHGMTDADNNYYFGTYDIDPPNPSTRGLPYEEFEALLDGIKPLRKMLLIDSCFSGEIDKDDSVVVARTDDSTKGQVSMRAFKSQRGVQVVADEGTASTDLNAAALRFQQDWFADLRRGTGAVVISSASGNEYAFEGDQWNNGVFTYALLHGLKNGAADIDGDQRITVGELQGYVIEQVRKLTAGGQNPTVRRENLDYDFEVY
jgi:WD40 repeat protein